MSAELETCDIEDVPGELGFLSHGDDYHRFDEDEVPALRRHLLAWFDANRRRLPWRGDPPPFSRGAGTASARSSKRSGQKAISSFFAAAPPPKPARGPTRSASDTKVAQDERSAWSPPQYYETPPVPVSDGADVDSAAQHRRVTPYATWVSEIMLQQTRVDTVIDYFQRWMERFPTPAALAAASEQEVNEMWAGLGYYRRARLLHAGAQKVCGERGGSLPSTVPGLLGVPGVGKYTAGAVASIAFGQRAAAVDGNLVRVFSRLRALGATPADKRLVDAVWDLASTTVDPARPGDFNQALMELGATVCTPKLPACDSCPVRSLCHARRQVAAAKTAPAQRWHSALKRGRAVALERGAREEAREALGKALRRAQPSCGVCVHPTPPGSQQGAEEEEGVSGGPVEASPSSCSPSATSSTPAVLPQLPRLPEDVVDFPRRATKRQVPQQHVGVWLLERAPRAGGAQAPRLLVVRRPKKGILAGQWEVAAHPLAPPDAPEPPAAAVAAQRRDYVAAIVGEAAVPAAEEDWYPLGSVTHIFSHLRHVMHVSYARCVEGWDAGAPETGTVTVAGEEREWRWVDETQLASLGATAGVRKVLALWRKARKGGDGEEPAKRARRK